ncbi:MAG: GH3 auxin-responsive promoter family protein, partial [Myxococcota bacterium]
MGADALFRYLVHAGDSRFATGFTLGLLPPTTMKDQGPVKVTCNPALMFAKVPAFARPLYIPHGEARDEPDYDKKLGMIAEKYLDHDVRTITGTTCWFSLLFDKVIEVANRRGRRVRHVAEVWPNLNFLIGGGVAADPYLPVIRERIGREDIVLVDTYNATEGGLLAVSDHSGESGMLVIPDRGVFFEFVPVEELDSATPTRVPLWGVEKDRNYAILVTTCSGLYAYKLGDIVRFPSVSPLRMEFAGRLAGCLSTTQELTTHVEVQRAMEHALDRFGVKTVDFAAGADVGVGGSAKSRYIVFAEFEAEPPTDAAAFAHAFDEGLCAENRVYREHRSKDAAILAPELVVLPRGAVARFMRESGRTSVQTKFPRIVDDAGRDLLRSLHRETAPSA